MAAFTQNDLAAVRAALLKGERTVQFADRSVTYRSVDEILQVEQRILSELTSNRHKQFIGVAGKGL